MLNILSQLWSHLFIDHPWENYWEETLVFIVPGPRAVQLLSVRWITSVLPCFQEVDHTVFDTLKAFRLVRLEVVGKCLRYIWLHSCFPDIKSKVKIQGQELNSQVPYSLHKTTTDWFCPSYLCLSRLPWLSQIVKNLPATKETWIQSLGQEDPLEKGMATHSNVLAWRTPWTEKPGGL